MERASRVRQGATIRTGALEKKIDLDRPTLQAKSISTGATIRTGALEKKDRAQQANNPKRCIY
jgi:hypothetical protein